MFLWHLYMVPCCLHTLNYFGFSLVKILTHSLTHTQKKKDTMACYNPFPHSFISHFPHSFPFSLSLPLHSLRSSKLLSLAFHWSLLTSTSMIWPKGFHFGYMLHLLWYCISVCFCPNKKQPCSLTKWAWWNVKCSFVHGLLMSMCALCLCECELLPFLSVWGSSLGLMSVKAAKAIWGNISIRGLYIHIIEDAITYCSSECL